ncbi:MAG TPA: copper homeostasis protein CutC [Ferruginibacter sp.]|nr:copper homeostasis protein CutC [Ferruginibacter sp.]
MKDIQPQNNSSESAFRGLGQNYLLEVIGFNIDGCIAAASAGAHRIELCDNPGDGGTTPSYGFIKAAREQLQIELYPIIRPRGGDFLYSEEEFEIMKSDIEICNELDCEGVVIGMLNANGTVDKERCGQLVELAYPMGVTFHRAFDRTVDPLKAMEDIIEIGCERILTSGQKPNALDGADLIAKLIEQANEKIIIMPGSGVRSDNIVELARRTKAVEFHTSARITVESKMGYNNKDMNESLRSVAVDTNEIKKIIDNLKNL